MKNTLLFNPALLNEAANYSALKFHTLRSRTAGFMRAIAETEAWQLFPDESKNRKATIAILTDKMVTRCQGATVRGVKILEPYALAIGGFDDRETLQQTIGGLEKIGNYYQLRQAANNSRKEWATCALLVTAFVRLHSFGQHPPASVRSLQPSLQKAIDLLRNDSRYVREDVALEETSIKQTWNKYRKVAHILAARHIIGKEAGWNDFYNFHHFMYTLAWAKRLREILLSMINSNMPHGRDKHLFQEGDFIQIPEHSFITEAEKMFAAKNKSLWQNPFVKFSEAEWKIFSERKPIKRQKNRSTD